MANVPSAEKRNRQRLKRRARNLSHLTKTRTLTRRAGAALTGKDHKGVADKVKEASQQLARAASKGIVKKKTASRKISRMAKALNKLNTK